MRQTAFIPSLHATAVAHPVRLGDGTVIEVRAIQPDDGERVRRWHARLSHATIMARYLHFVPYLTEAMISAITHVDYLDRMALVAAMGAPGASSPSSLSGSTAAAAREIVSVANYERISSDAAEVAFLVEDAWQGRGIASLLLYDLAAYAHACGFRRFLAVTLSRNTRMLDLLTQSGFPCMVRGGDSGGGGDDEVAAWLDISTSPLCRFARFAR